jgi:hypothetical protein
MAAAFKPTFGRLNGTVGASGATDHDALLEASELMPVGAEQVFEKVHSIPAHDRKSLFAVKIGLPLVYFENEPGRRSAAKLLSKDERGALHLRNLFHDARNL